LKTPEKFLSSFFHEMITTFLYNSLALLKKIFTKLLINFLFFIMLVKNIALDLYPDPYSF